MSNIMDKKYSTKILAFAKKYKAVHMLGGCCKICGETNIFKLCFHHKENEIKEYNMNKLRTLRWSKIEKELKKCDVYCQNCHQELHDMVGKISNKRENKKIYFQYIGNDNCSICGYNKCYSSLNFHHIKDKKFEISDITTKFESIADLKLNLQLELEKCVVVCRNCHSLQHSDTKFYSENFEIIKKKSENLKNVQSKIDRNVVFDMFFNKNLKQNEIAKYFKASKGTISDIIKKLNGDVV